MSDGQVGWSGVTGGMGIGVWALFKVLRTLEGAWDFEGTRVVKVPGW
jgi:hypothetical protein